MRMAESTKPRMPKKGKASQTEIQTNPDDQTLFRAAMQDVAPLPASNKVVIKRKKPDPIPRSNTALLDDNAESSSVFMDIAPDGEWSFLRPGVSQQTLRRLRNRYWPIQDTLDLHGMTQDSAKQQLAVFLDYVVNSKYRCVRIVHGKGLSSADGVPVLKQKIGGWLAQYTAVLAFCQAKPEDGGGGAVLVLLKK